MAAFKQVILIYNPNSTGDSKAIAENFKRQLTEFDSSCKVILKATDHAGHGEALGYTYAKEGAHTLLISVSGDGGYHELVNGVMRAVDEGFDAPICAVLPGGNANDHYRSISDRSLYEAISTNGLTKLDLLKIECKTTRYAHSYAGLGLTPLVAVELNKHKLSAIKELWLALKTFWKFKPFIIIENGKQQAFDSIILANIGVMAKHLTLVPETDLQDGKFEVVRWPHNHKVRLSILLFKSAFGRGNKPETVTSFTFRTVTAMPMQLDGELMQLNANQRINVSCARQCLRTYR